MKVKISVLILILFCVILNAQSLYNTKLYGFNGIVKTVTSYEYENQDLKKENYKSKTMLYFNTSGELTKSIRDIKSSDRIYTFKSTFISAKNKVFQLRYDYDSKLSDSITYEKINKNLYSIHGKEIETNIKTIGKHINNALKEELADIPVVAIFATTSTDGKTYQVEHYNLDMIISIGYRVKSNRGIQFRIWAN